MRTANTSTDFGTEPGWSGAFTRAQAPGAIPNGTPIVKVWSEPRDANPNGTKGVVLGSLSAPPTVTAIFPDVKILYFVEWETMRRKAIGIVDKKIARLFY